MKSKILGLVVAALFVGSVPVSAETIYSNLGSSDSFGTNFWILSSGSTFGWQFTPVATGMATSIDAAIFAFGDNNPTEVTVGFSLYADSGNTPSELLETFSITSTSVLSNPLLASASLAGTTQLTAGSVYWLVGSAVGAQWGWYFNNAGAQGLYTFNGGYGPDNTLGAFRINGDLTSVPEPGTLALLGLGLAGLGLSRRRRAN